MEIEKALEPQKQPKGKVLTWSKGKKSVSRTVVGPDGNPVTTKSKRAETHIQDGIRIREITKRTGRTAWRVEPPPSLREPRKEFADLERARGYATQIAALRERTGKLGFELSDKQRVEAVECFRMLESGGTSLTAAVTFFLRHSQPAAPMRVPDAVEAFLESPSFTSLRPKTQSDYRSRLRIFAASHPTRLASEVFPEQIGAFLSGTVEWKAQTRLNYWRVLHSFFAWCEGDAGNARKGCIPAGTNPVSKVNAPKTEAGRKPGVFTVTEIRLLLQTAELNPELELGPALVLGCFCGLRPSEIERLDWQAIHLAEEKPFVAIEKEGTKGTFSDRNVEIPSCAVEWLKCFGTKSRGKLVPVETPRKRWLKLRKLAGVETWPQDGLRHTFASHHFAIHGSTATQAQLGHTTDATLFKHYRRLVNESDAKEYFQILPTAKGGKLLEFKKAVGA